MSRRLLLADALLLDPEASEPRRGSLLVEDGRIRAQLPEGAGEPDAERVDLAGRLLAPGFLDVHYHGRLVFCGPQEAGAALREAAAELLREGTTAFLPTTVAWPGEELRAQVEAWAAAVAESAPAPGHGAGASPLGLHLEGPWIRPEAAGAQPARGIRPFDPAEGEELLARAAGGVRMVTFAPEVAGAEALLAALARRGIVAALGHTHADAEAAGRAAAGGAQHVTHLFNAMSGLHHRTRGVAGVALADDRLTCDLICDGVHVHPDVVRVAARAKGERLLLITDRVDPSGEGFGSGAVRSDGEALRLPDGTLAGSALRMDRAVRNARAFGACTRLEAISAATVRPARLLGVERERGTLRAGARADLVVLSEEGAVEETWLAGTRAWSASRR